jgi:hypothetical protein
MRATAERSPLSSTDGADPEVENHLPQVPRALVLTALIAVIGGSLGEALDRTGVFDLTGGFYDAAFAVQLVGAGVLIFAGVMDWVGSMK